MSSNSCVCYTEHPVALHCFLVVLLLLLINNNNNNNVIHSICILNIWVSTNCHAYIRFVTVTLQTQSDRLLYNSSMTSKYPASTEFVSLPKYLNCW